MNSEQLNKNKLQSWFSSQRFRKFEAYMEGDTSKAEDLYKDNILLSEALYPVLSVFEVALRNAIHIELENYHGKEDWYEEWRFYPDLRGPLELIESAIVQIQDRQENINPGKIIAEMTLGFWISLFNARYERKLWKPLRLCFKQMPKNRRQRHVVSSNLNKIRALRNRIYHYEPICWNLNALEANYQLIITTLGWIDQDLVTWSKDIDGFPEALDEIRK